jgi:endonuclease V-like protein UPF0215 family
MQFLISSFLLITIPFSNISHPHEEDPYTTYIQEKLIDLGFLDLATGINDKTTQVAIKTFQEKAGLVVDGMVGDETFSKLLLGESAYLSSLNTTPLSTVTTSTTTSGLDTEDPIWDEDSPPYASEIGSLFNLNIPSVTDNVGVVSYEIYVNGALSTYATISDTRLLVTPKYDLACADQIVYLIAFDAAGNSSQSPTFTIPQSDPCISVSSSSESSSQSSSQTYFAVTFGGTGNDVAYVIAVDSSGNSYITGYFNGTVDFGGGDVTSAGDSDIFVLKLDSSGTFQWVKTFGSAAADSGYGIAVGSSGNSYITGYFNGTVDFGGGDITSAGSSDIFVLKLDSSGTFQWVKTFGSSSSDYGRAIAVDSSGNSYITGRIREIVDFGGGDVTFAGGSDIFVLKLDSSGTFQWANSYGDTSFDLGYGIAVDSSGNSYITGNFFGTVDFGGGDVTSAGGSDIFVLKLNSSGTFQWVKTFGSASSDYGYGIAVDSSGNSYATGPFFLTVDFGGGDVTSAGFSDIFVLKLNSSGTFQWVKTFGSASSDYGYGIAVDSSGNSYITGYYGNTIDFGGGNVTTNGNWDVFVLKLNSSGTFQWVNTYGGTALDYGYGIAVDSSGNSYATGAFFLTVDFGGGAVTSAGGADFYVLKLNSSGGGIE